MSLPKYLTVLFFLFLLLSLRTLFYYRNLPNYQNGQIIHFTSSLSEEPQIISGKQKFSLKDNYGRNLSITTSLGPFYQYGDRVEVSGKIKISEYKGRQINSLYFPKIKLHSSTSNPITQSTNWLRDSTTQLYQSSLPPVSASLLQGIVFGGKQGMPDDFLKHLRAVGVMHVIAASGMNVTFVAGALISILGRFLKRRAALIAGMLGIIFYAYLAGFEASILRASIMALLAFGAGFLGRQYFASFSLLLTGIALLFYSPVLLFDIGFWLSFLSTLGILFIQPLFKWGKKWYIADIATTVSAQIATLPIMLAVFGQYGLLSVLVNALVLWMIPFLMILGSTAVLIGILIPFLGKLVLFLCLPFLWYFEWAVDFFGNLGFIWQVDQFPLSLAIGYYCILIAVVVYTKISKVKDQISKPNVKT